MSKVETPFIIEVRLTGGDLPPERVNARDAAALIAAVEGMLAAVVARDRGVELNETDVVISLAELRPSGYALVFTTPHPGVVENAFAAVVESVTADRLELLPIRAIDALREVRRISRKYGIDTEFAASDGKKRGARRVIVRPSLRVEIEQRGICGTETIYGTVIRVGGEEPPRAKLRLLHGQVLTCDINRRKSWMIARELGGRLYQIVGVRGEARYSLVDRSILHFRIESVLPFSEIGIDRALNALADAGGAAFAGIDGLPDAFNSALDDESEDL